MIKALKIATLMAIVFTPIAIFPSVNAQTLPAACTTEASSNRFLGDLSRNVCDLIRQQDSLQPRQPSAPVAPASNDWNIAVEKPYCTITRSSVNLRSGWSTSSDIVQVLNPGDSIYVHSSRLARDNSVWSWVTDTTHKKNGWVVSTLAGTCYQ